jgi:hypothetical protein
MKSAIVSAVVLGLRLSIFATGGAHAQGLFDHLACHTVDDPSKVKATADLAALRPDFSNPGCAIGKPKLFCVPVAKTNLQPPPARPDIVGQPQTGDFICYKLKCPLRPPGARVTDQFGSRVQKKYTASLLCVPAVTDTGAATTTTTTTTTTTSPGAVCGGLAGTPCPPGSFCELPRGQCCCDFQGVCVARPSPCICAQIFAPVCGCDGVTYGNDCERRCAGASAASDGPCP